MPRRRNLAAPKLVLGISLLALGVLFTLENLGLVDARPILAYWPIALIVLGLLHLLGKQTRWLAGLGWMAAGILLLFRNLNIIHFDPFDLWPLVLVFIGLNLVTRSLGARARCRDKPDALPELSGFAFWTGLKSQSSSERFEAGDFTAIMGGCEVDLSQADLGLEPAVIDVLAFWGGVEILVPADWTVTSELTVIAGGFENTTGGPERDSTKQLVLRGLVLMGGVEVNPVR